MSTAHVLRPDTGVTNSGLGIWLFLASEVMLFGALFSAYALLRISATSWPSGWETLDPSRALVNTLFLVLATANWWSASKRATAWRMLGSTVCALIFLVGKVAEYRTEISRGMLPSTSTFLAIYFTLTGLHALHVAAGVVANLWAWWGTSRVGSNVTAGRVRAIGLYWTFVDVVWLIILVLLYLS